MVKISVDGKSYEVKPGKNLLETCLSLGIDIPHFCFHPALGSVGACRLCAVKKFRDKDDAKGRVVMSCMEPVTDGLIISVDDPEAMAFRASVIESLMTNHPHDCPVCDEGGECHLQDMTVMTGHNYRRYDFPKRTYNNQELGPFISHEMNRCIQCYRCVRFYRDYAGGKDLNVFSSRNHVYFGRHEDGTLENEFSGNLVEVCPTGVFTDKTLKNHYTRKWDLSNSPSVCVHCSVGCNTIASERYGSLRRIMSRYNGSVNGYFICDRGRFGYEFVNDEKRIKDVRTSLHKEYETETAENRNVFASLNISLSKERKIVGIGSPRASMESNFTLMSLVGKENFFHGVSKKEYLLTKTIVDYFLHAGDIIPSLKQIEKADAVLVLGEDLTNTAPMIALALRQAARSVPNEEAKKKGIPLWNDAPVRELVQDAKSPVFIVTPFMDSLDDISENSIRISLEDITILGSAVAHVIDNKAPENKKVKKEIQDQAGKIAGILKNAKSPLIISGTSNGSVNIINSALNITTALLSSGAKAMVAMVVPESNSIGLSLLPGISFEDINKAEKNNEADTLVVLENDLFRRLDEVSVNEMFKRFNQIVALDHLVNKTTQKADFLLPAATFSEGEGTLISYEGRAQRYYKSVIPQGEVKESWRWLTELISTREGEPSSWKQLDDIINSMASQFPQLACLKNYLPDADFRMLNAKIPRQPMRYSGRTAMNANIAVSEAKLPEDNDSPLAFSMEGQPELPPSSMVPFYWTPGWNSVQAMYNYLDEPDGHMKGGDPGVRLFGANNEGNLNYLDIDFINSESKKEELLLIPVYKIFGSEELSGISQSVLKRIPEPFVLLNQNDAGENQLKDGDPVLIEMLDKQLQVKVKIENSVVKGMAGLSTGFPGMPYIDMPCGARLRKV